MKKPVIRIRPGRMVLWIHLLVFVGYAAWLVEPWSSSRYVSRVHAVLEDEEASRQLAREVDMAIASLGTFTFRGVVLRDASYVVLPRLGRMASAYMDNCTPPLPAHVRMLDGNRIKARVLWLFRSDPAPGVVAWDVWEGRAGVLHRLSTTVFVSRLSPLWEPPPWTCATTNGVENESRK